MFATGTDTLEDCVMIQTLDDIVLEGDHEFSVGVDGISPPGAVTATESFSVTITDDDGMIQSVKWEKCIHFKTSQVRPVLIWLAVQVFVKVMMQLSAAVLRFLDCQGEDWDVI